MNMHTLRHKKIDVPGTMNWTHVGVTVRKATDEAATQVWKGNGGQQLVRRAYRVGTRCASGMMFLLLGATGLWTVVDLAKIVGTSFKDQVRARIKGRT
jgi:hypothetical protein